MSFQIPDWFVQQYSRNVMTLVQQEGSRLRSAVRLEPIVGKSGFVDRLGPTVAQLRTSRHGDSPLVSTPHSRRRLDLLDYEWGDLVDNQDKIRMLHDPTSPYAVNASMAMGRQIDQSIIDAFNANALAGAGGAGDTISTVALPAGQIVADDFEIGGSGVAGLTLDKVLEAKRLLDAAEVPDGDRFFVAGSTQFQDLLNISQIQSSDFNTVKALVRGEIDSWLGFTWIRSELLDSVSGPNRECYAWSRPGMALGIGAEPQAEIARRADKSFATYVYYAMSIGSTRLEEERVVQVLCRE